jgi:NitT/TauT family transport system substrate-binding protein
LSSETSITLAPNGKVFDLPAIVAIEEGIFERHGLSVSWAAKWDDRPAAEREVFSRLKESLFETGNADVYNVCTRAGQVAVLRAAVAAQALVTFDDALNEPHDLGDVAIGVNEFTGSHYTSIQMLEGTLPKERIKIEHVGGPEHRLEELRAGRSRVVALMEPFISLAVKEGAHIVASTFYRGADIVGSDLSDEQREQYLAAINEAVDVINADRARYAAELVSPTKGALAPEELLSTFARYIHVTPYPRQRLQETYDWMRSWDLIEDLESPESLVVLK